MDEDEGVRNGEVERLSAQEAREVIRLWNERLLAPLGANAEPTVAELAAILPISREELERLIEEVRAEEDLARRTAPPPAALRHLNFPLIVLPFL